MAAVVLYRVTHGQYAEDVFSGEGGMYAAGRWHRRGRLVRYASDSLALATLEQIARAGTLPRLQELVFTRAELDDEAVHAPPVDVLPRGWDRHPPGRAFRNYGEAWLAAQTSVALRVPTVIMSRH